MKKLPFIVSAVLLIAPTTHAQTLGGIVDKAKGKAMEAKRKAQEATEDKSGQAADDKSGQAADDKSGKTPDAQTEMGQDGLPLSPEEWTVESQEAYVRTIMADKRPVNVERDRDAKNYHYRLLTQTFKMPIRFTWDRSVVNQFINPYGNGISLWSHIEMDSSILIYGLTDSRAAYYKLALQKIKEVHYTAAPDNAQKSTYSFNPTTGVLTEALKIHMNVRQPEIVEQGLISEWIYVNMTKAPKRAAPVYAKQHASSWRCARCGQVVRSRPRPSDADCPGDGVHPSGFHQWIVKTYEKD